ncbi:MAG: alpha/beta hydrolase family protein [Gammaproteobacteria bacterium]|nr:alpha/beta hydrolase family protein [Gammaproteobacteria bacterium]
MNVRIIIKPCVLVLLLCVGQAVASEPDFARETRLSDEIVDVILDGDPVWLEAGGREFLSIYTEAEDYNVAVIILHGRGFHPDWADTINPLRVDLVERGYSTLSLQMPVLEKDAKYYDYVPIFHHAHPRIEAGIQYLRDKGFQKIVLLAHSCGVHMAMDWIRTKNDRSIDAFIGLGMGATDYKQPMHQPFPLDWMHVPILDLYGANEFPAVIRLAPGRKAMIEKAGHKSSQQLVLPGSDHYFTDQGDALVNAVADWLDQLN